MKHCQTKNKIVTTTLLAFLLLLVSCQSPKNSLPTASSVDLESFMGTWYVVGYTPILVDGKAHNATEHYYLQPNDRIQTTYQYRNGSFDGSLKTFRPKGFVYNKETHAEWRMQFIWPFRAEYRIIFLTDDYSQTVIGRSKRDYVWVMARTPTIPAADYERIRDLLAAVGYDLSRLQHVPQQPLDQR